MTRLEVIEIERILSEDSIFVLNHDLNQAFKQFNDRDSMVDFHLVGKEALEGINHEAIFNWIKCSDNSYKWYGKYGTADQEGMWVRWDNKVMIIYDITPGWEEFHAFVFSNPNPDDIEFINHMRSLHLV